MFLCFRERSSISQWFMQHNIKLISLNSIIAVNIVLYYYLLSLSRGFWEIQPRRKGWSKATSPVQFSFHLFRFFSFASLSILWLVATIRRIMSKKEHHNQYCQDISPFRIGVFCHKCGKDDFGRNTRSLSSHVWYCKPSKITTHSNLTRRNQRDKVALLLHDSGTSVKLHSVLTKSPNGFFDSILSIHR